MCEARGAVISSEWPRLNFMWTYLQIGVLLKPNGQPHPFVWYSGFEEHANVPGDERLKGLGPLPRGTYRMVEFINHPTEVGPVAIRLSPDPATRAYIVAFGRNPDSFMIHDGHRVWKNADGTLDHTASKGCVCCTEGTVGVEAVWASGDHELRVLSGLDEPPAVT